MFFVIAFLAVGGNTASTLYTRWLLKELRPPTKVWITASFLIAFLITAAISFVSSERGLADLTIITSLLILASVAIGITHNIYGTAGLRRDSLRDYELVEICTPFLKILLAALLFTDERAPLPLMIALVAAAMFFYSHFHQRHLKLKQADRWLLFAVCLMAVETMLVKPVLGSVDPITFYALRAGLISLMMISVFHPPLNQLKNSSWLHIGLNIVLGLCGSIAALYSIQQFGIVFTELLLLLRPVALALVSALGFKETWTTRQSFSFGVMIVCVALVQLVR